MSRLTPKTGGFFILPGQRHRREAEHAVNGPSPIVSADRGRNPKPEATPDNLSSCIAHGTTHHLQHEGVLRLQQVPILRIRPAERVPGKQAAVQ